MAKSEQSERTRGGAIPLKKEHWWPPYAEAAVMARAKAKGKKQPGWRELAQELIDKEGVADADDDKVRRCVRGEVVTWEIAIPLSRMLGILPPAFIADTFEEAEAMADGDVLDEARELLNKAKKLALRIASENDQTPSVASGNEQPQRRRTEQR